MNTNIKMYDSFTSIPNKKTRLGVVLMVGKSLTCTVHVFCTMMYRCTWELLFVDGIVATCTFLLPSILSPPLYPSSPRLPSPPHFPSPPPPHLPSLLSPLLLIFPLPSLLFPFSPSLPVGFGWCVLSLLAAFVLALFDKRAERITKRKKGESQFVVWLIVAIACSFNWLHMYEGMTASFSHVDKCFEYYFYVHVHCTCFPE